MHLPGKYLLIILTALFASLSTASGQIRLDKPTSPSLTDFKSSTDVMVVAHRGDWRNAPENSVWAINMAIEKGVDMVEIDLARTKDGVLILMHDKVINRTTTGEGKPADYTWEELQVFFLKDGLGVATQMKIPRLDDILDLTNGRVLLNLDKGYDYIQQVYPMLKERGMLDQVLFKGGAPYERVRQDLGSILDSIHYMPIIPLEKSESRSIMAGFMEKAKPFGFEFTVGTDESNLIDFESLRKQGYQVWVNALWPHHNAGHQDDLALENSEVYAWYLDRHINIIQTDRPAWLLDFLIKRKRHR